jgi:hypothetical protein
MIVDNGNVASMLWQVANSHRHHGSSVLAIWGVVCRLQVWVQEQSKEIQRHGNSWA